MAQPSRVTQLVLLAAGLGTRLRPLTNTCPKALVKVGDKPLLEYVLLEAAGSGLTDIIIVINPNDRSQFAEALELISPKLPHLNFQIVSQNYPFGNGQALLQAAPFLKNNPFVVRFCDDFLISDEPPSVKLIGLWAQYQAPILLLHRLPEAALGQFGVVGVRRTLKPDLYEISAIVEKPKIKDRKPPSNLTILGLFILTPEVLDNLDRTWSTAPRTKDGLILYVGLEKIFAQGRGVYGWEFPGQWFDCGNLLGLQAAQDFFAGEGKI